MNKKPDVGDKGRAKSVTVVVGLDENGKPKGARFNPEQMEQAIQAAQSLNLEIYDANSDEMAELARKLPSGRIYAQGRAFIPFIKRELYDKVCTASGGHARDAEATYPPSPFPPSWDDIAPGHVVLAPEGIQDGWWEAVVLSRDDRTLTLRYRDYPKLPKRVLDIHEVALVHPGPE